MAKIRVYELARELNVESKVLLQKIKAAGLKVASHQSTLSDEEIKEIRAAVAGKSAAAGAAARPKVIRRRRKAVAPQAEGTDPDAAPAAAETSESAAAASQEAGDAVASPGDGPVAVASPAEQEQETTSGPGSTQEVAVESESLEPPTRIDKPKGAATIVRRATPEEVQSLEQAGESRRRTVRKEDSRGTRVTSLGLASEKTSGHKPMAMAPSDAAPASEDRGDDSRRRFGRPDKKKGAAATEEEHQKRALQAAKTKRSRNLNMRALLNFDSEEVEEEAPSTIGRTVYTPTASNRRRDLKRRKDLKKTNITTPRAAYRVVKMEESITVGDLSKQLSVKAGEVIKKLMANGVMATINQNLDVDTATLIAQEYGFEVKSVVVTVDDILKGAVDEGNPTEERSPIVTVMGHVDHGKTSILDAIRLSDVAEREAGGITQHIGAYSVTHNSKKITFIDTPGHEAFSAMRARGAKVTDIVVLVVAADDGVMPQTVEAISHAKEAEVPVIVAVNKIDKPNVNVDRIFSELAEHGIQAEDWGGEVQFVKCSALEKIGLDELLEAILLQSEILELKAKQDGQASGIVVEAHLDKGRGPVATILVQEGTLKRGDDCVAGVNVGRVRAMFDHFGKEVLTAGPSTPVEVLGLASVPMAGDQFNSVADEKTARDAAEWRLERERAERSAKSSASSLEDLLGKIKSEDTPEVALIVKGDTQGSVEAITDAVQKIDTDKVLVRAVHKGVGGVSESDISLAATSKALIVAFNVRVARGLEDFAEREGVVIKYFSIIYDVVDAVKAVMAGSLPPITHEVVLGRAEVRQPISVPKIGTIAGSAVVDGRITRSSQCRLIRDDIVIFEGKLGSLRRFKDDVKEVQTGYECGIGLEGYNDVKIGDVIEAFVIEEEAATL